MSKITQYLNEHILGEVTSSESVRKNNSKSGMLSVVPEIVIYPRVTNDIRKAARFSWQLAEKGHVLPITIKGNGSDQSGASIGKGIVIDVAKHLSNIIYINLKSKDQFVHVQPGMNFKYLNDVLESHGMSAPFYPYNPDSSTVGGALANNSAGPLSGQVGKIGDWVKRLEVVLANGDLIETSRISRHELNRKKGLQTFEGEIYRKIDGIIEDNKQVIEDNATKMANDNVGYSGIAKVKNRDGSFDLTPLIVGSQGTLGIISEAVIKTDFYNEEESVLVVLFNDINLAKEAVGVLAKYKPAVVELIDGRLIDEAKQHGKKYPLLGNVEKDSAIVYICFNDFSHGSRKRKVKHSLKKLAKFPATIITSNDHQVEELEAIRDVAVVVTQSDSKDDSYPSVVSGSSVPIASIGMFLESLKELEAKHHLDLPYIINMTSGAIFLYPKFQLQHVSDKQKAFKIINDYMELIAKTGGSFVYTSAEGRLKSAAAYAQIDSDVMDIYSKVRAVFDPFGTMNPGVKQANDLKTLVSHLDTNYR